MRLNYAKVGTIFMDKVYGDTYKVVSTDGDKIAARIDTSTGEPIEECLITVTEENCMSFRAIYIPRDTTIYGNYIVEDGKLGTKEYEDPLGEGIFVPVDQGEFYFNHIVGLMPGCIILEARTKESISDELRNEYVDYVLYEVERDKYITFATCVAPISFKSDDGERLVMISSSVVEKEVETEDGKTEAVKIADGADIYVIKVTELGITTAVMNTDLALDLKNVYKLESGNYVIPTLGTNEDGILSEDTPTVAYYKIPIKEIAKNGVASGDLECLKVPKTLNDEVYAVKEIGYGNAYMRKGTLFIKGYSFFMYDNVFVKGDAVRDTKGYNYLVDVTYNNSHEVVYSLSDEYFFVKKIKVTDTKDRGRIVKLEK